MVAHRWKWRGKPKLQVYAVVRIDSDVPGDDAIAVPEVLPTLDQADAEVARLNGLNGGKGTRYFWLATRFYPEGRAKASPPSN